MPNMARIADGLSAPGAARGVVAITRRIGAANFPGAHMSPRTIMPAIHRTRLLPQLRRAVVCAFGAWHLLSGATVAVSQDSASKVRATAGADTTKKTGTTTAADTTKKTGTAAAADTGKKFTPDQLDALVAPIALYPDDLLAQTLVASTYPLEIVQLQQWLAKNPKLKDKALADSVAKQPWDPSIQSMAALPDARQAAGRRHPVDHRARQRLPRAAERGDGRRASACARRRRTRARWRRTSSRKSRPRSSRRRR